jgi:hypothetical protein
MIIFKGVLLAIGLFVTFGLVYWYGILRVPFGQSAALHVDLLKRFGTFVAACGAGLLISGILTIWLWKFSTDSLEKHLHR